MVSIITAIYKSERYLPEFIKNAKNFARVLEAQNFPFELVVVATQPNGKEQELLKTLEGQAWCKVVRFDELGVFGAWNFGCQMAHGEVLGPWNVDDIRFPEAVMEAQQLCDAGAQVVYFPFIIKRYLSLGPISIPVLTTKIEDQGLQFDRQRFQREYRGGPHLMFTKQAWQQVGGFDEQFKIAGDYDWFCRAAREGLKFALAKNYSGIFRIDGRGMSTGKNERLQTENNIIFRRFQALDKITPGLADLESQYRVGERKQQGQWLPYNN